MSITHIICLRSLQIPISYTAKQWKTTQRPTTKEGGTNPGNQEDGDGQRHQGQQNSPNIGGPAPSSRFQDLQKPIRTLTGLTEEDFTIAFPNAEKWTKNGVVDVHKKEELYSQLWIEEQRGINSGITEKLKAKDDWATVEEKADTLKLLRYLKEIRYQDNELPICPPVDTHPKTQQEELQMRYKVMKAAGIQIVSEERTKYTMKRVLPDKEYITYVGMKDADKKPVIEAAEQILLSVQIIKGSKRKTHRNLQGMLKDEYCLKKDAYPTAPSDVLNMLLHFKTAKNNNQKEQTNNNNNTYCNNNKGNWSDSNGKQQGLENIFKGTAFVTNGEASNEAVMAHNNDHEESKDEDELSSGDNSLDSNWFSHMSEKPRSVDNDEQLHATLSNSTKFLLAQNHGILDPDLLLLDGQASCNVVSNKALLKNIFLHPNDGQIVIHCNAGSLATTMVGDFPGFGMVWWYLEGGIANILSLCLVSDKYQVTLDTSISQSFYVHKDDGTT
eukprot:jgi/Psemu1/31047/gm1.31047_g